MISTIKRILGSDAVAYGNELAREVAQRYPLSLDGKGKVSAERISRILEKAYTQAQEYQKSQSLGWMKRARLCHAFKWQLDDMGYSQPFIELATEGLVVYLSKPDTKAPQA